VKRPRTDADGRREGPVLCYERWTDESSRKLIQRNEAEDRCCVCDRWSGQETGAQGGPVLCMCCVCDG